LQLLGLTDNPKKEKESKKMRKTQMPETSREFLFAFDRFVDDITNPQAISLIINPNKTLTDQAFDTLMLAAGIFIALQQYTPETLEFAFQGSKNSLRASELYFNQLLSRKAVK
jgi:hypothetical protein